MTAPEADRQSGASHLAQLGALSGGMERAGGFDRSQLHSDERPPIGDMAAKARAEAASEFASLMLGWN